MVAKATEENGADLILVNGKVFTADPTRPYAEAVAIRGERILAVGTSAQIAALAGVNTHRIDLQGHVTIPGINDAHYHFPSAPLGGHYLAFQSGDPSWQETQDALAEAAGKVPAGTWIFGYVDRTVLEKPEAHRFALDRHAPDHPVYLLRGGLIGGMVNTKAMRALEISEEAPDPLGGRYERVPGSMRISGKVFGYASYGVYIRLASRVPDADLVQGMQALADEAVRYGLTSIQVMTMLPAARYVRLLKKAHVPIRVRVIRFPLTTADGRDLTEGCDLPLRPAGQPLVTVRGTKWILDGTQLEWAAALRGTYRDRPDWSGWLRFSEREIASMVHETLQWDDQLLCHSCGDRPVELLFDAMEQVQDVDWAEKRVRIEHANGLAGDLIPRAHRLGVVVVQTPLLLAWVDLVRERYGLDTPFFPVRTLLEAGVPLAIGSDNLIDPYLNIRLLALHLIHPAEAITREQAVEAYTRGSAFAEFEEGDKGTLARGKLADIAVLSQDIFTVPLDALPGTQSILTLVGGKVVYDGKAL